MDTELLIRINRLLPAPDLEAASDAELLEVDREGLLVAPDLAATIRQWRPEGELRAAASIWTKYLFRQLLPPLVLGRCWTGRPLAPTGSLTLVGGLPQQWHDLALTEAPADPVAFLAGSVAAVSESTGLRPRVLWSNIGNQLEALLGRLPEEVPEVAGAARECAALWLETPYREGRRNPLYRPVIYRDGTRLRRVCCLRNRRADLDYCSTCPLPEACGTGS